MTCRYCGEPIIEREDWHPLSRGLDICYSCWCELADEYEDNEQEEEGNEEDEERGSGPYDR